MKEVFKIVKGYPYEVSNLGRVRRADTKNVLNRFTSSSGYRQVNLGFRRDLNTGKYILKNGKRVQYLAHVSHLVAEAFVENPEPDNFTHVVHKDGNKQNDVYTNLVWTTLIESIHTQDRDLKHSEYMKNRITDEHRKKLSEAAKKRVYTQKRKRNTTVQLTNKQTNEVRLFESVRAAAKFLGVNPSKIHYNSDKKNLVEGYFIKKMR